VDQATMFCALKSLFFLQVAPELGVDGSEAFGRKKARSRITNPNFIKRTFLLGFLAKVLLPLS